MQSIDWSSWMPQDDAVICFAVRRQEFVLGPRDFRGYPQEVLLIRKKRGLGRGKINGPGGRLEPGETPLQAAVRETYEEVGITLLNPVPAAELSFAFTDGYSLFATVFVATRFRGKPTETPEATPFWCPVAEIPYDEMWADDYLWLPGVLAGQFVRGRFVFDADTMLSQEVSHEDRNARADHSSR